MVFSVKKSQHIDLWKDNSLLALGVSKVCALEFKRKNNLSELNGTGRLVVSSNLNCIMKSSQLLKFSIIYCAVLKVVF